MEQQKIVLITGVSRGIGRALAEKFLDEGWKVLGTSTSGTLHFSHPHLHVHQLDLSSPKSIASCVTVLAKEGRTIDVLINNAGIWSGKDDPHMSMQHLRETLEVNLFGTIDFCERLIPLVKQRGKIIFTSSRAGSLSHAGYYHHYPDYRISKAGVNMYMRTLALRLKSLKILVASIHPGWVKTDMGGNDADLTPEVAAEKMYKRINTLSEIGQFWFGQRKFAW
jgi:NAD(P)-dependent dehydrogenase (short-subunit alcohol dehydrogenase family)